MCRFGFTTRQKEICSATLCIDISQRRTARDGQASNYVWEWIIVRQEEMVRDQIMWE